MASYRVFAFIMTLVMMGTLAGISVGSADAATKAVTAKITTAPMPALSGVGFANDQLGWLVGNQVIMKTTDGGIHFVTQYRPKVNLQNIQVLNPREVIAWGGDSILATTNGGGNWKILSVPGLKTGNSDQILSLHFFNANEGYVLLGGFGTTSFLYLTKDGGAHWTKVWVPGTTMAVGFHNTQDGWLISASTNKVDGGFYRTVDGGKHWTKTQTESANKFWYVTGGTIDPVGIKEAYAQVVGQPGMSQSSYTIFHTKNGVTWQPILGISTAGGGFAPGVGKGKVAVGPGYDAGPMAVIGTKDIKVAGGMNATGIGAVSIASTSNGGAKWTTYPTIPGANGFFTPEAGMSFVNANDGWLLDSGNGSSELYATHNGGATWKSVYPQPANWPVMGVTFVTAKIGYGLGVTGDLNVVLKTTDGGHIWKEYGKLPAKKNLPYVGPFFGESISFLGNKGMAAGGDGKLYQSTNRGKSWALLPTPPAGGRVFSVYMASGTKDVVINMQNGVYVSNNGGDSWSLFQTGNAASGGGAWMQAVNQVSGGVMNSGIEQLGQNAWASFLGSNGSVVWMEGTDGVGFLKSTDRGKHWTAYQFSNNFYLMNANMGFLNSKQGWLWTLDGRLFITDNGGANWQQVS